MRNPSVCDSNLITRLVQLAMRLGAGLPVTSAYIREHYGVSRATAARDLVRLEVALPVEVTETRTRCDENPSWPPSKSLRLLRLDP